MSEPPPPRTYRKSRRAELEAETRERIVVAAVDLHGSIGPAHTTVTAVAQRAGVQRATVYRHFADEQALFAACSAHWIEQNPPPNPEAWLAIGDTHQRLQVGLTELYAWYARTQGMIELLLRDVTQLPSMQAQFAELNAYFDTAADTLAAGRCRAVAGHAVAFETWRSLVVRQHLTDSQAVRLMTKLASPERD